MTEETTAFANARIFDGTSAELREGCVRVAAGTITEVAEGPGPGDRILDCRGRTIVPGLIDAHFHAYGARLSLLEIETSPLSYLALAGAKRLAGALGRGFTTVRDPGGGDAGLAQAIREGLTAAPRYLFCGPALSQTGGHGDPRPPELGCCLGGGHMAEVVDGVDALRRAARERLRSGAHAIKIMASGGVISPSDPLRVPQYSPEEIRVVAEEATRRGSYVAAHAYSAEAIGVAVANGVRSIEHGNLLDAPTAALMAERDAFLVPTLVTYDAMERRGAELGLAPVAQAKNREVLDAGRTAIRLAREAGVRIGFGTDLMGSLDDEQLHGLRLQAEVEGPLALLRAATSVNAELLGRDDLGRIGPGAVADLLVLDADPLRDPSVLWGDPNRRAVYQGGIRVAEQGARLALLPRTAARAGPAAAIRRAIDLMKETTFMTSEINSPAANAELVRAGFQAFNAGDVRVPRSHRPRPHHQPGRTARTPARARGVAAGLRDDAARLPRPSGRNRGHRGRSGQDRRPGAVPWYPHRRVPRLPRDRAHRRVRQPRVLPHRRRPHRRGVDLLGYGQPVPPAQLAADVVSSAEEMFTYWHLRLLVRRMRLFRQVSYWRAATGLADAFGGACPPTFRAKYLPAGATPHCIDFILTAGEVTVESVALVFAEKESLGYVSDHIGLSARLSWTPTG